jgi:hypothetical protein
MSRTQTDMLLDLFRIRGYAGVTDTDAYELAGCRRLAARVYDLKRDGHVITSEMVAVGRGKRVARYVLHEKPEQMAWVK